MHQEATQGLTCTQQGWQVDAFNALLGLQVVLQGLGHHGNHPQLGVVIVVFARDGAGVHRAALSAELLVNEANDPKAQLSVQECADHVGDGLHTIKQSIGK